MNIGDAALPSTDSLTGNRVRGGPDMAIPAAPRRASGGRALAALGGLRDGLEPAEAADLVWVHNDPALYHRLVIERRWAKKHFETWLYQTLRQQLRP